MASEDPGAPGEQIQSQQPARRSPPGLGDLALGAARVPFRALRLARRTAAAAADGAIDRVVDAVDVDEVVRRVDVEDVVRRIDVEDVVRRIDVDDLAQRVDIEELARRTDIASIVSQSAGSLPRHGLAAARRTLQRLDELVERIVARVQHHDLPATPEGLAPDPTDSHRGRYAGPVSRLAAYLLDASLVGFGYGLFLGAVAMLWGALTRHSLTLPAQDSLVWAIGIAVWAFFYFFGSWSLGGQTPAQSLTGIAVVTREGGRLRSGAAAKRTLAYPTVALVIPLVGVLFGRERRALHDVVAASVVVYD